MTKRKMEDMTLEELRRSGERVAQLNAADGLPVGAEARNMCGMIMVFADMLGIGDKPEKIVDAVSLALANNTHFAPEDGRALADRLLQNLMVLRDQIEALEAELSGRLQ